MIRIVLFINLFVHLLLFMSNEIKNILLRIFIIKNKKLLQSFFQCHKYAINIIQYYTVGFISRQIVHHIM